MLSIGLKTSERDSGTLGNSGEFMLEKVSVDSLILFKIQSVLTQLIGFNANQMSLKKPANTTSRSKSVLDIQNQTTKCRRHRQLTNITNILFLLPSAV